MTKKKLTVLIIIAILVLCVIFRYCSGKFDEKKQHMSIMESMTAHVEIMNPFDIEISNVIEAPGRVLAAESVDVIARVPGVILKQHYKDGDIVKKGQILYTLESNEYQIGVKNAQANLETAKANQYRAQKDFERAAELVKSDYISKAAYDQAYAAKNAANGNVKSAQAALDDARRLLGYTKIYAPITGKISMTKITEGNYMSSPNTVLTKIVKIDPIYVTYAIDSAVYGKLRNDEIIPGKNQTKDIKIEITLPDGTIYDRKGSVDFLDNVISETTGSITLRATFDNPEGRLISGDFVNVKVYSNKVLTSLAVPQKAVLQDSDGRYLFTVDENSIAHKTRITVSGQKDDNWLVTSGVTKKDKIISSGISLVRDGVPVKLVDKKEDTKDGKTKE